MQLQLSPCPQLKHTVLFDHNNSMLQLSSDNTNPFKKICFRCLILFIHFGIKHLVDILFEAVAAK